MSGVPKFASVRLDAQREAELRARVVAQEAERVRKLEEQRRKRAAEVERQWSLRAAQVEERRQAQLQQAEERRRLRADAVEQRRADAQVRRDEVQARREQLQARRREEQAQRTAARSLSAEPPPPAAPEPPAVHEDPPQERFEEELPPAPPVLPHELVEQSAAVVADADVLHEELLRERLTSTAARLAAARQTLDTALEAGEVAALEAAGELLARQLRDGREELRAAVERRERHAVVVRALMRALPADLVVDAGSLAVDDDGTTRLSAYAPGSALHVAVTSDADGDSRLVYTLEGPAVQRVQHENGTVSCDSHEQVLTAMHAAMETEGVNAGPLEWAGRGGAARRVATRERAHERKGSR